MSKASINETQIRNVVQEVLETYLDPTSYNNILQLWDESSNNNASVAVVVTNINQICLNTGIDTKIRQNVCLSIAQRLRSENKDQGKQAIAIAIAQATQNQSTSAQPIESKTPTLAASKYKLSATEVVFRELLKHIQTKILATKGGAIALMQAVEQYMATTQVTRELSIAFSAWCYDINLGIKTTNLSTTDMAEVINLVYVCCCTLFGPVAADRLLMQAVHEAEKLPEAHQFPPNKLL